MSYIGDHIFGMVEENDSALRVPSIRLVTKEENVHDFLSLYVHGFIKDDFMNVVA